MAEHRRVRGRAATIMHPAHPPLPPLCPSGCCARISPCIVHYRVETAHRQQQLPLSKRSCLQPQPLPLPLVPPWPLPVLSVLLNPLLTPHARVALLPSDPVWRLAMRRCRICSPNVRTWIRASRDTNPQQRQVHPYPSGKDHPQQPLPSMHMRQRKQQVVLLLQLLPLLSRRRCLMR